MNVHHIPIKLAAFSLAMVLYACSSRTSSVPLHPVVLIPGSGGNQLEARLTEAYKSSSLWGSRFYPLKKDPDGWFRIWFDPSVLLRPFTKCFNQRMMIYYDPAEDDYHNAPGVETRVPYFGSTQGLLYLDPSLKKITSYMEPLVRSLESIGYTNGKTLFGAPYDFRYGLAAEGHRSHVASQFLSDLKTLIESASASNGGKPVILLSHSLGGLFALHLLARSPISWRRQFIRHFISMSAPWGGTIDELLTFASGNALGVPIVDPLLVREHQRSSSTNLWLLPSPRVFDNSKPLVTTPDREYCSDDISIFLRDIGFSEGVYPYEKRILPLVERLPAPEVPVTCVIGSGVETPERLVYGEGGFEERPAVVYGDGDGTVNMVSLLALETAVGNETIKVVKIDGVSHTDLLKDETALSRVIGEISSINSDISGSVIHGCGSGYTN